MNSQNKLISKIALECVCKKIELVVTPTGAVVNSKLYTGDVKLKATYKNEKVEVFENGECVKVVDLSKPTKLEDKKAVKKKPKNNKPILDMPDASV